MSFQRTVLCLLLAGAIPFSQAVHAQEQAFDGIHLELNTMQDTESACRLTFVARNGTAENIEQAVFETVIFDGSGNVTVLSLFDFRELPPETIRVRQFDVPGTSCQALGQVLINGASTCAVAGSDSDLCRSSLSVSSRISVELLG